MKYHLDFALRLNAEPEQEPLYSWAITEIDGKGAQQGYDQIPWGWTLGFEAKSCLLGESFEITRRYREQTYEPLRSEIAEGRSIRIELIPAAWRDNRAPRTRYSMFGTDRTIEIFQLDIRPITDPKDEESCTAWGCVSYTSEVDFVETTNPDCVVFSLFVQPSAFERYASMVRDGCLSNAAFYVGRVRGFYSEWSPTISTSSVKVLCPGDNQTIDMPAGCDIVPDRLGEVGSATLYLNRRLEFGPAAPHVAAGEASDDAVSSRAVDPPTAAAYDYMPAALLRSTRIATWVAVGLLALLVLLHIP